MYLRRGLRCEHILTGTSKSFRNETRDRSYLLVIGCYVERDTYVWVTHATKRSWIFVRLVVFSQNENVSYSIYNLMIVQICFLLKHEQYRMEAFLRKSSLIYFFPWITRIISNSTQSQRRRFIIWMLNFYWESYKTHAWHHLLIIQDNDLQP